MRIWASWYRRRCPHTWQVELGVQSSLPTQIILFYDSCLISYYPSPLDCQSNIGFPQGQVCSTSNSDWLVTSLSLSWPRRFLTLFTPLVLVRSDHIRGCLGISQGYLKTLKKWRVSAKWSEKERGKIIGWAEQRLWKIDWNAINVALADEACYIYQVSSWVWMNWAIMLIWSSLAVELYRQHTRFYRQ